MARPSKEETLKKETKEALLLALEKKGTTAQYYKDQVEEYMRFYDNLVTINSELNTYKERITDTDDYTKLLKEKRLISKEMRGILKFLNITPEDGVYDDSDDDEEL